MGNTDSAPGDRLVRSDLTAAGGDPHAATPTDNALFQGLQQFVVQAREVADVARRANAKAAEQEQALASLQQQLTMRDKRVDELARRVAELERQSASGGSRGSAPAALPMAGATMAGALQRSMYGAGGSSNVNTLLAPPLPPPPPPPPPRAVRVLLVKGEDQRGIGDLVARVLRSVTCSADGPVAVTVDESGRAEGAGAATIGAAVYVTQFMDGRDANAVKREVDALGAEGARPVLGVAIVDRSPAGRMSWPQRPWLTTVFVPFAEATLDATQEDAIRGWLQSGLRSSA
jgi:hypothetical protein